MTYHVDRADRLAGFNDEWTRFAIANDAAELVDGALNRPLWAFISDVTTAKVYHQLMQRVRTGRTITFPFRCDAPSLRRWMQMRMSPLPDDAILFESAIVESLPASAGAIWDRRAARGGDLVTSCSWCKRIRVEDRWEEIEVAVELLAVFLRDPLPMITHGMCPDCHTRILSSLTPGEPELG